MLLYLGLRVYIPELLFLPLPPCPVVFMQRNANAYAAENQNHSDNDGRKHPRLHGTHDPRDVMKDLGSSPEPLKVLGIEEPECVYV